MCAERQCVVAFVGRVRDGVDVRAESAGPDYGEVTEAASGSRSVFVALRGGMGILAVYRCLKNTAENTHIPTIPTFFPGPHPALTSGLYVVIPAHSIGAASLVSMLSGILKVKYSWARMWLEKPPWATVPSG